MAHAYVATVMAAEVDEVDGGTYPEVEAWQPHENSVLETLGEVWVFSVPGMVPILTEERKRRKTINPPKKSLRCYSKKVPVSNLTPNVNFPQCTRTSVTHVPRYNTSDHSQLLDRIGD